MSQALRKDSGESWETNLGVTSLPGMLVAKKKRMKILFRASPKGNSVLSFSQGVKNTAECDYKELL